MSRVFQEFVDTVLCGALTERQKRIAMLRQKDVFGFDVEQLTLRAIGNQEGLSTERIRQILFKIRQKIGHRITLIKRHLEEPQVIIKYIERPETPDSNGNLPIVYKPIEALGDMSVRVANALNQNDIKTIEQLLEKSPGELLRMPNFGRKSLRDVEELLENHDLKLEKQK